jgi:hypothetical protein
MKIIPTGTRNHSDTDLHSHTNSYTVLSSADENADIFYANDSYSGAGSFGIPSASLRMLSSVNESFNYSF